MLEQRILLSIHHNWNCCRDSYINSSLSTSRPEKELKRGDGMENQLEKSKFADEARHKHIYKYVKQNSYISESPTCHSTTKAI